jgi:energy-converting hydrogenase Eha subunit E
VRLITVPGLRHMARLHRSCCARIQSSIWICSQACSIKSILATLCATVGAAMERFLLASLEVEIHEIGTWMIIFGNINHVMLGRYRILGCFAYNCQMHRCLCYTSTRISSQAALLIFCWQYLAAGSLFKTDERGTGRC